MRSLRKNVKLNRILKGQLKIKINVREHYYFRPIYLSKYIPYHFQAILIRDTGESRIPGVPDTGELF